MVAFLAAAIGIGGCAERLSRMEITDYREGGSPARYQEVFRDAYFDIDASGNVDVVLVRGGDDGGGESDRLTQIVHIRSLWRSIPGRTVADRTQINATVRYYMVSGAFGETFEGAGSVFFRRDRRRDTLSGSLDLARLKPARRLASDGAIFQRADFAGEFHAVRDRRRVVRLVHDVDRRFSSSTVDRHRPGATPNVRRISGLPIRIVLTDYAWVDRAGVLSSEVLTCWPSFR